MKSCQDKIQLKVENQKVMRLDSTLELNVLYLFEKFILIIQLLLRESSLFLLRESSPFLLLANSLFLW
jgi:hypothetical protein